MKAYESHAHYPSKVRECSNFAIREIRKVCNPYPEKYEITHSIKEAREFEELRKRNNSAKIVCASDDNNIFFI